ncbi:MAG: DUF120 domain-containing protein [Candidatus Nanopelagicales bacterium]
MTVYRGRVVSGKGIASDVHYRRMEAVEDAVGYPIHPGTLNVAIEPAFNWNAPHHVVRIPEAENWGNLRGAWGEGVARVYPVVVDDHLPAWVLRLDSATSAHIELIAPLRLREHVGDVVEVVHL